MALNLLPMKNIRSSCFLLVITLLISYALILSIGLVEGREEPSNIDLDPKDRHKTTFCTCQCCSDTMCSNIPNATFAVASCFECTKYVCDALDYPCKTTLYRAQCIQKNDVVSQIIIIIVFIWIFSLIVASIGKVYVWPIIMKIRKRRAMGKSN